MAEYDLVIRNTTIATAADVVKGDIGISAGRVVALGERLDKGKKEIDATGLIAVPGGIDAHVHFDQDTADGSVFCDDFESGSRAAAAGGTTTIIPFAYQSRGQGLRDVVDRYHKRANGKSLIDYAFHVILSDPSEKIMGQDFPALVAEGYTSFKVYMTYDDIKLTDRQMLDALAAARREQAMLMIHAENSDCIAWLTERLELKGMTAAKFHATSRPFVVEREATHRAISLAELLDVPMLLVHVSAKEAMHEIQRAQARGLKVYGETCPQYLFLSEEDFEKPGDEGSKCVCSPPPRGTDNQEHIWTGLSANTFQVLSSDHAAFKYDDVRGKKLPGADKSFAKIPNGVPGVETRLPLLFSEGVNKGRITLQQFVALVLDQCRQDLRPASAQGHDRGRRRCRHRAVGSPAQGEPHQLDPAPQLRLHALRGPRAHGLSGDDPVARRGRHGRSEDERLGRPRPLPEVRPARGGAAARQAADRSVDLQLGTLSS